MTFEKGKWIEDDARDLGIILALYNVCASNGPIITDSEFMAIYAKTRTEIENMTEEERKGMEEVLSFTREQYHGMIESLEALQAGDVPKFMEISTRLRSGYKAFGNLVGREIKGTPLEGYV